MTEPNCMPEQPSVRSGGTLKMMSRATYFREALLKNLFLVCAIAAVAGVALLVAIHLFLRGHNAPGD